MAFIIIIIRAFSLIIIETIKQLNDYNKTIIMERRALVDFTNTSFCHVFLDSFTSLSFESRMIRIYADWLNLNMRLPYLKKEQKNEYLEMK